MVWIEEETFIFYNEDSQTEEQVAQRGCAISIEGFQDAQSPQQPGLISSLIMVWVGPWTGDPLWPLSTIVLLVLWRSYKTEELNSPS